MNDLYPRLWTQVNDLLTLAQRAHDAAPGNWRARTKPRLGDPMRSTIYIQDVDGDNLAEVGEAGDARLIVTFASPDVVLRQLSEDLRILIEHTPIGTDADPEPWCLGADHRHDPCLWPCSWIESLARRWGIET